MSEATLKRKSQRVKNTISGKDKNGFSLNGGYRNKGWVGQENFFRPDRTSCTNDPNIIKRSTMNTNGLILSRIKFPTSVFTKCSTSYSCIKNWVKNFKDNSQSEYIRKLKIKSICNDDILCQIDPDTCKTVCDIEHCEPCSSKSHFIGTRKIITNMITKNINRGAISSSDYTSGFLHKRQCLPTPPCKQHFPMAFNHNGCDINYLTPQHAIRSRVLPPDWGTCIEHEKDRLPSHKWKYSEDATLVLLDKSTGTLQNTDGTPTRFCSNIFNYILIIKQNNVSFSPLTSNPRATFIITEDPPSSLSYSAPYTVSMPPSTPLTITRKPPLYRTSETTSFVQDITAFVAPPNKNIKISVTSQDHSKIDEYNFTVQRQANSDNTLQSLIIIDPATTTSSLSPSFSSGHTAYIVNVSASSSQLQLKAKTTDSNAVITIFIPDSLQGTISEDSPLSEPTLSLTLPDGAGDNSYPILIKVIAENNSIQTYTVTIKINPDTRSQIQTLTLLTAATTYLYTATAHTISPPDQLTRSQHSYRSYHAEASSESGTASVLQDVTELQQQDFDYADQSIGDASYCWLNVVPVSPQASVIISSVPTESTRSTSKHNIVGEGDVNDGPHLLLEGQDIIFTIFVIPQDDEAPTAKYKVKALRNRGTDATLKSLQVKGRSPVYSVTYQPSTYTSNPNLNSNILPNPLPGLGDTPPIISVTLNNILTETPIEIIATPRDVNANVTADHNPFIMSSTSPPKYTLSLETSDIPWASSGIIPLQKTLMVYAQDTSITKTYIIKINRQENSNSTASLTCEAIVPSSSLRQTVNLVPGSTSSDYTALVGYNTTSYRIIVSPQYIAWPLTVMFDGSDHGTTNGDITASYPVNSWYKDFDFGEGSLGESQRVTVTVTSQDQSTTSTYIITITREPTPVTTLSQWKLFTTMSEQVTTTDPSVNLLQPSPVTGPSGSQVVGSSNNPYIVRDNSIKLGVKRNQSGENILVTGIYTLDANSISVPSITLTHSSLFDLSLTELITLTPQALYQINFNITNDDSSLVGGEVATPTNYKIYIMRDDNDKEFLITSLKVRDQQNQFQLPLAYKGVTKEVTLTNPTRTIDSITPAVEDYEAWPKHQPDNGSLGTYYVPQWASTLEVNATLRDISYATLAICGINITGQEATSDSLKPPLGPVEIPLSYGVNYLDASRGYPRDLSYSGQTHYVTDPDTAPTPFIKVTAGNGSDLSMNIIIVRMFSSPNSDPPTPSTDILSELQMCFLTQRPTSNPLNASPALLPWYFSRETFTPTQQSMNYLTSIETQYWTQTPATYYMPAINFSSVDPDSASRVGRCGVSLRNDGTGDNWQPFPPLSSASTLPQVFPLTPPYTFRIPYMMNDISVNIGHIRFQINPDMVGTIASVTLTLTPGPGGSAADVVWDGDGDGEGDSLSRTFTLPAAPSLANVFVSTFKFSPAQILPRYNSDEWDAIPTQGGHIQFGIRIEASSSILPYVKSNTTGPNFDGLDGLPSVPFAPTFSPTSLPPPSYATVTQWPTASTLSLTYICDISLISYPQPTLMDLSLATAPSHQKTGVASSADLLRPPAASPLPDNLQLCAGPLVSTVTNGPYKGSNLAVWSGEDDILVLNSNAFQQKPHSSTGFVQQDGGIFTTELSGGYPTEPTGGYFSVDMAYLTTSDIIITPTILYNSFNGQFPRVGNPTVPSSPTINLIVGGSNMFSARTLNNNQPNVISMLKDCPTGATKWWYDAFVDQMRATPQPVLSSLAIAQLMPAYGLATPDDAYTNNALIPNPPLGYGTNATGRNWPVVWTRSAGGDESYAKFYTSVLPITASRAPPYPTIPVTDSNILAYTYGIRGTFSPQDVFLTTPEHPFTNNGVSTLNFDTTLVSATILDSSLSNLFSVYSGTSASGSGTLTTESGTNIDERNQNAACLKIRLSDPPFVTDYLLKPLISMLSQNAFIPQVKYNGSLGLASTNAMTNAPAFSQRAGVINGAGQIGSTILVWLMKTVGPDYVRGINQTTYPTQAGGVNSFLYLGPKAVEKAADGSLVFNIYDTTDPNIKLIYEVWSSPNDPELGSTGVQPGGDEGANYFWPAAPGILSFTNTNYGQSIYDGPDPGSTQICLYWDLETGTPSPATVTGYIS